MTEDELIEEWPEFLAAMRKRRETNADSGKQAVVMHLDADVVDAFKAEGPGWKSRINEALREAKKLPKRA